MANSTYRRRSSGRQTTMHNKNNQSYGSFGVGRTKNYTSVRNNLQNKISAFRTLYGQTQITGPNRPTPAMINKFTNFVIKGAVIHKVPGSQIAKWCKGTTKPTYTTGWATKWLKNKFGATCIKGVCPTGNGKTFLVATSPTWKGKPFKFPKW